MFWVITRDYLADGDDVAGTGADTRVGMGEGERRAVKLLTFKLYDDDGEIYYCGVCDQESLDADECAPGSLYRAFTWAMADAGATDLRIAGKSIFG